MRLVYVHDRNHPEWHRSEIRAPAATPLPQALCGETAGWEYVWNRAVDPPGTFCTRCDELARILSPGDRDTQPATPRAAAAVDVDALIASVWGEHPPPEL